jgi:hypothetical protein
MNESAETGREPDLAPVQSALRRVAVLPILPGDPLLCRDLLADLGISRT